MLSDQSWRARRLLRRADELVADSRYVDFGVRLFTVHQSSHGRAVYPGRPLVVATDRRDYGGILDTRTRQFVGPSANPIVLFASAEQARLIRHAPSELPLRVLTYGAEGAGKTRGVLAPWVLFRALEFTGYPVEIGGTAPTDKRISRLRQSLLEIMPPDWYTHRVKDNLLLLRNGVNVRLVSTKRYSENVGSPVQGWDWVACASDELQDSLDANDDIETRGRAALNGEYRRMNSATAKDSPRWRAFRDRIQSNSLWSIERLPGATNPFVFARHWDDLKRTLDRRSYQRRVLAMDVAPEKAVYTSWHRDENICAIPQIGARDITSEVLARFGAKNQTVLVGHDPGRRTAVSMMLKAYRLHDRRDPVWWIVDEMTTRGKTADEHAAALAVRLRERWGCHLLDFRGNAEHDSPTARIHMDPMGNSANRTHRSIYQTFAAHGLKAVSAEPPKTTLGRLSASEGGVIPKEAGIEMINRLLGAADGTRRLYVACDHERQPVAPKFVEAVELSERDANGEAETGKKDDTDLSHWMSATRYALWPLERDPMHWDRELDRGST